MERAGNVGVRVLEVQIDFICTVKLLSTTTYPDHQHATIVCQYRRLLDRNWKVTLKHIYRSIERRTTSRTHWRIRVMGVIGNTQ
ncbi:hypothetical protein LINPERHAP1_LOCUS36754 [Linum perenne]